MGTLQARHMQLHIANDDDRLSLSRALEPVEATHTLRI